MDIVVTRKLHLRLAPPSPLGLKRQRGKGELYYFEGCAFQLDLIERKKKKRKKKEKTEKNENGVRALDTSICIPTSLG